MVREEMILFLDKRCDKHGVDGGFRYPMLFNVNERCMGMECNNLRDKDETDFWWFIFEEGIKNR